MFTVINEMVQNNYTVSYQKAAKRMVLGVFSSDSVEQQLRAFRKTKLWGETFARADAMLAEMSVLLIRDGDGSRVIVRAPIGWVDVTHATERELVDLSLGNPCGDDPLGDALRQSEQRKRTPSTGAEVLTVLGMLFGMAVVEEMSKKK